MGASAGGLESLLQLVTGVALDHMAFVVVQHLMPDRPSALASLLARKTNLSVRTATENVQIERNNIYVMPPNASLTVEGTKLCMGTSESARTRHLPVDTLLTSLAQSQGSSALGVVLSGTGTDGTEGMRAIKEAGGLTFVEEPRTAGHAGMPQSVIDSGHADFVMKPGDIGREINLIVTTATTTPLSENKHIGNSEEMRRITAMIKSQFGTDLFDYKAATVERRIIRRMAICKTATIGDYVQELSAERNELRELYRDLLINVTSFFRDSEAFKRLQDQMITAIVKRHRCQERPIRVWVTGCATGEEAYSVAICFAEALEVSNTGATVQVFATDLSDTAIIAARRGLYAKTIANDMSPTRLERFFVKKSHGYQVCRRIRDMVVISNHNLLKDAPFSRIDLVTCRNVLIYLRGVAQKRALQVIHYALLPHGFLMLGASETVGDSVDLFKLHDRKAKVYTKNVSGSGLLGPGPYLSTESKREPQADIAFKTTPLQSLAERYLLDKFCPPGVIVNGNLDIVHFRGHTGMYLDPIPGAASFNVLRLARQDLTIPIKRLTTAVLKEGRQSSFDTKMDVSEKRHELRIHACPLTDADSHEPYLLILFEPLSLAKTVPPQSRGGRKGAGVLAKQLKEAQEELQLTKEYLQATIEEKETAIEELKASNEELQSTNEELQSTNEELETSKEEMQSANEELTTVNDELYNRMNELNEVNDDFHNIQSSVENAIVLVGMDLRIRRYTLTAEHLFNLVPSDAGREVSYLEKTLNTADLADKVSQVIARLAIYQEECKNRDGRWLALRISPYRTQDHTIRGAVLSVNSVDLKKRSEVFSQDISSFAERLYGIVREPMALVNRDLEVCWSNRAFLEAFGFESQAPASEASGLFRRKNAADENLRNMLSGALSTGDGFSDSPFTYGESGGGATLFSLSGNLIPDLLQAPLLVVTFHKKGAK